MQKRLAFPIRFVVDKCWAIIRVDVTVGCCFLLESTKPGVSVTVMNLEPNHSNGDLNADLGMLATEAMPIELCNEVSAVVVFRVSF